MHFSDSPIKLEIEIVLDLMNVMLFAPLHPLIDVMLLALLTECVVCIKN